MRAPSIAALVALALGGCGLLGEDPFPGVPLADVAPFEDLGPIVFTVGTLRLGPAGSKPAGLCVADDALPACTADADCGTRERCSAGRCQIGLCDRRDECSPLQSCNFVEHRCDRGCARDADCAAGETCPPGLGVCRGHCAADADCQHGELCESGLCLVALSMLAQPCAADADCPFDRPRCLLQRVPSDLREPAPVTASAGAIDLGSIPVFFERREPGRTVIVRADCLLTRPGIDRARCDLDPSPAIEPGPTDGDRAGAPSILVEPGRLTMIFADGAGRLRRAVSADGRRFTVEPPPVLVPRAGWEASGLDSPSLIRAPDGGYLLYYGLTDRSAIGLAESADGITFTSRPDPVVRPADLASPIFRDLDRVGGPFAELVREPGASPAVRLFIAARGRETGEGMKFGTPIIEPPNWSIAELASLDGRAFVPFPWNPIFDRAVQFLDHRSELEPALLTVARAVGEPGDRALLYRGASADESAAEPIGLAISPPSR